MFLQNNNPWFDLKKTVYFVSHNCYKTGKHPGLPAKIDRFPYDGFMPFKPSPKKGYPYFAHTCFCLQALFFWVLFFQAVKYCTCNFMLGRHLPDDIAPV